MYCRPVPQAFVVKEALLAGSDRREVTKPARSLASLVKEAQGRLETAQEQGNWHLVCLFGCFYDFISVYPIVFVRKKKKRVFLLRTRISNCMLAMHVAVWYQSCYYKIAASDSAIVFGTAKALPLSQNISIF